MPRDGPLSASGGSARRHFLLRWTCSVQRPNGDDPMTQVKAGAFETRVSRKAAGSAAVQSRPTPTATRGSIGFSAGSMFACAFLATLTLLLGGCDDTGGEPASPISTDTGPGTAASTAGATGGTTAAPGDGNPGGSTGTAVSTGFGANPDAGPMPDANPVSDAMARLPDTNVADAGAGDAAPVADAGGAPDAGPTTVTVRFIGALVGPAKANGDPWDFDGSSISEEGKAALAQALLGANPYASVLALMSGPLLSPVAKPDPFGTVTVETATGSQTFPIATEAQAPADSFALTAASPPGWRGVTLGRDIRFLVNLWDSDLVNNDPIGTAEINMDDVKAALAAERVYHVKVSDQTFGTILFVDISVIAD